MKDFKNKIEQYTGPKSNSKEKVKYRRANKWLDYSSEIAKRIIAVIEDTEGMTQVKLAEKLEVSPQRINTILKGKENLTLQVIYDLSIALGVELISFPPYKYSAPLSHKSVLPPTDIPEVDTSAKSKSKGVTKPTNKTPNTRP